MRFIIRAVKERQEFVNYLQKNLPQAEFCFDKNKNAMDTFLDAMQMAGNEPAVHMEEDILLTKDFVSKITTEIAKRPNELIQFFSMRGADLIDGSRYDNNYIMNQCFYLPAGYSKMIYEFYPNWNGKIKDPTGTDIMINDWLKARKEKYWISIPSLVEHRVCKSTINPKRSSKRQSKTFQFPIDD